MSDYESDDDDRINEVQVTNTTKKAKSNGIYQRAARPTTYEEEEEDDDEDDEAQFNRQLRLENSAQTQAKTKVDPDGTVYEWDPTVKGWFVLSSSFLSIDDFALL